jgi:tRNA modification GTPase
MSTIVALSTPPGHSAIAVIRLSGPDAIRISHILIQERPTSVIPRQVTLKAIRDTKSAELVDRVLITYMQAPNSFTGEEMIEISCHGSPIIVRRIIDLVLENGARLAGPGEFSLRAVENGKLDLSQAEAIRDLINAQTEAAARQALRQLNGELTARVAPLRNKLIEAIVRLESAVEFVEDDLPEFQGIELAKGLRIVASELNQLASSFSSGHWLRDGIKVTIAGRPNVGKSSLFNSLLKHDRAIVTSIPGTTRDTLNETISIAGVPVCLTDTAGVRGSPDEIESIGIDRTHKAIADSDLVLFVVDGTEKLTEDDLLLFSRTRESRYLLVINKRDLPGFTCRTTFSELGNVSGVPVSALRGEGLEHLCQAMIRELGVSEVNGQDLLVTDARHYDLLCKSREQVEAAIRLVEDHASEELVLVGLHNALTLLGAITGETTSDQILSQIFATFCIGK